MSRELKNHPLSNTEISFKLSTAFIKSYENTKPPFGFNGLGELVYYRTYSRLKKDGANEKWFETVRRVVEGTYSMQKRWVVGNHLGWNETQAQKSAQEMYDRMFNMKFLPPGRGLWAMGSELTEERNLFVALNNCAFHSTENIDKDSIEPFCFLMEGSMLGIGVGFDTKGEGKFTIKKPKQNSITFVIPDSREGWVESLRLLLLSYFEGAERVEFDYTEIRKAGEPIRGFGGISSGFGPLKEMHETIVDILEKNIEEKITSTIIVDLMNIIGRCVVSGNIRRSAEISFGSPTSEEYLNLKNYKKNPHRKKWGWASNNSVFADVGMNYDNIAELIADNGEPGFAWLENMRAYGRFADKPNYKDKRVAGANPCLTDDAWVMTTNGPLQIKELVGTNFEAVVDGLPYKCSSNGFFETGTKEVIEIKTKEGFDLKLTPNHLVKKVDKNSIVWVEAGKLNINDKIQLNNHRLLKSWNGLGSFSDGWLLGNMVGDGFVSDKKAVLDYWGETKADMLEVATVHLKNSVTMRSDCGSADLNSKSSKKHDKVRISSVSLKKVVELYNIDKKKILSNSNVEKTSSDFHCGFLQGWFDADGSVQGTQQKGVSVRLDSVILDNLKVAQRMLARLGIISTIYENRVDVGYRMFPDGKGGSASYLCQSSNSLVVSKNNLLKFYEKIGFADPNKMKKLSTLLSNYKRTLNRENFIARIKSITSIGTEKVYDTTIDIVHEFDANGISVHNCNEQSLENGELCCLVETFPAKHESLEDYKRTLKFAYLYAKTVTLGPTPWEKTNKIMSRNRRIGCSMSGIVQAISKLGIEEFRKWCNEGYKTIQEWDEMYSDWLAIHKSIKTTSIKPSGSVSLLNGSTPGMHYPESKTYLRRVRLSKYSELIKPLKKAGYYIEDAKNERDTVIVEIPIKLEENVRTISEVSMWEQLNLAAFLQENWADNQVSCTVTFDPKTEGSQIANALNYFQYKLKGISFLPKIEEGAYEQMPYENISEKKYNELVSKIKSLNINIKNEEVEVEKFCDNSSCQI